MSTIFTDISAALDEHLNDMAGLPVNTGGSSAVAWENKSYDSVEGELYLRPTNLQDTTQPLTERDFTLGIYQIDIFAPWDSGKSAVNAMVDLISDRFKTDTVITYNSQDVRIMNVSREAGVVTDNGWFLVPVMVNYDSFTQRR